jgi:nitrite reductase (NO-forming)
MVYITLSFGPLEDTYVEFPLLFDHSFLTHLWPLLMQVPGPFIRTRVGDVLDVTLQNSDMSGMLHNLDFHAVTGPGGGAHVTTADSGGFKRAIFKLLKPGLFIYHCAVAPVGEHIGRSAKPNSFLGRGQNRS